MACGDSRMSEHKNSHLSPRARSPRCPRRVFPPLVFPPPRENKNGKKAQVAAKAEVANSSTCQENEGKKLRNEWTHLHRDRSDSISPLLYILSPPRPRKEAWAWSLKGGWGQAEPAAAFRPRGRAVSRGRAHRSRPSGCFPPVYVSVEGWLRSGFLVLLFWFCISFFPKFSDSLPRRNKGTINCSNQNRKISVLFAFYEQLWDCFQF